MKAAGLVLLVFVFACGSGEPVVIGSKNFTEQDVLGEILAQEIEDRGIPVERRFHLGGTFVCHNALVGGEIDLYPEYTGTALTAILKHAPVQDPERALREVAEAYALRWDLVWGPPLGFENTFALVVRRADAESLDLRTITDLGAVAAGMTAGFGPEFMAREDGYPGLKVAYGFEFGRIRQLDLGLMYRALAEREIDVAVANSTDGRIDALDLVVLADDRRYFPPYQAAPVVREEALDRHRRLGEALAALAGSLDEAGMRALNREVESGADLADVVRAWRERRVRDREPEPR
ncbi:MAG TPA: glycine betaine ABC transporter substrate-binding protein [Gemmatimonadota bacterium]|nr:glycine betaine ABC transporter substrate-binding protein [Gemmatimonadota bacterium]